jgi:molybdenum cofactor guanylyltransferase
LLKIEAAGASTDITAATYNAAVFSFLFLHGADMDAKQITGLILAGGRGSRMGSVDKGLQPFRGAPMVMQAIMRLSPQVGTMLINANQNLGAYESFGLPVWPDQLSGFEGPLAGLETGLTHCETDYLVSAPCDSPFLPEDLVARLGEGLAGGAELAVAVTGEGATRQRHPVFCLMKASVLPSLTLYLQGGERKMEKWYRSLAFAEVHFPDEAAFRNINTLDELHRFEPPR